MTTSFPPSPDQVFLSYSRNDRDAAIQLRVALQQAGLGVFKDDKSIRAGDRWLDRLQGALQGCGAFVLLLGRDGVRRWVGAEVEVALTRHFSPHDDAHRLPIFPVLLDGVDPKSVPPLLALFQATPWTPDEPLPEALIEAIRSRSIRHDLSFRIEGCPFVGLAAFTRKDAHLYFGRGKEVIEALACLGDARQTDPEQVEGGGNHRWLQIEGNSGAGKSSLVRAGMLPMIEQGALWARTGFEHWTILGPIMPGNKPFEKLAEVLERGLIQGSARPNSLERLRALERDDRALAFALRDELSKDRAALLIIDQFEELFTFADQDQRKRFDAALAHALSDPECPLFMISTMRADFLDRYEVMPHLAGIYNTRCKRYLLPTISQQGLREAIELPARLAGLDVREVKTAILREVSDLPGALPLVENALNGLWHKRTNDVLSGDLLLQQGGVAGMLSSQADQLLARVARTVKGGRERALELLLSLTRINEECQHSRRRIRRDEALRAAGGGEAAERVLNLLAGERDIDTPPRPEAIRLITISEEKRVFYVDLMHETLVRPRSRDEASGKRVGYWPCLYDYVEANRDRDIHRQQLEYDLKQWQASSPLGRWRNLAGWRDLGRYGRLRLDPKSAEGRFLLWSRCVAWSKAGLFALFVGVTGQAFWWVNSFNLPPVYAWHQITWLLGHKPLPQMIDIQPGRFLMGCKNGRDDGRIPECDPDETARYVVLTRPFALGKFEVSFLEYDFYVWHRKRAGIDIDFPQDQGWGRGDRPAINLRLLDVEGYLNWLNDMRHIRKAGTIYRLPTEAEWEYAARAGTEHAHWWGPEWVPGKAVCGVGGRRMTAPRNELRANPWGLVDMLGNASEFTADAYGPYADLSTENPHAPSSDSSMALVLRGGSWADDWEDCRAATRQLNNEEEPLGLPHNGLRVFRGVPIGQQDTAVLNADSRSR